MDYGLLLLGLVLFIVSIFFTRWIFGIDDILKHNKMMIGMLIEIAKKNGSTQEEIDSIIDKVYGKLKIKK